MYIIAIFSRLLYQILLVSDAQVFGVIYISNLLAHVENQRVNMSGSSVDKTRFLANVIPDVRIIAKGMGMRPIVVSSRHGVDLCSFFIL